MAILQVKGIDDELYAQLGKIAAAENRSISQQVLYLIKGDLANLAKIRTIEQSFEIIPTGQESAETFARLKSELECKGTWLDDFDLLIASCALAHNLTLVSNNTKHFG